LCVNEITHVQSRMNEYSYVTCFIHVWTIDTTHIHSYVMQCVTVRCSHSHMNEYSFIWKWMCVISSTNYRALFAKEPLIIELFCGKWRIKVRDAMDVGQPVFCTFNPALSTCFIQVRIKTKLYCFSVTWISMPCTFNMLYSGKILTWIKHVTYEWVMSHMIESCHIHSVNGQGAVRATCVAWLIHMCAALYAWHFAVRVRQVMSHINESCLTSISHVTYEWVVSHAWHFAVRVRQVTWLMPPPKLVTLHLCHTFEWVKSHGWMSHVTHFTVCATSDIPYSPAQTCHTYSANSQDTVRVT